MIRVGNQNHAIQHRWSFLKIYGWNWALYQPNSAIFLKKGQESCHRKGALMPAMPWRPIHLICYTVYIYIYKLSALFSWNLDVPSPLSDFSWVENSSLWRKTRIQWILVECSSSENLYAIETINCTINFTEISVVLVFPSHKCYSFRLTRSAHRGIINIRIQSIIFFWVKKTWKTWLFFPLEWPYSIRSNFCFGGERF